MRTDTEATVELWQEQALHNLKAAEDFKLELTDARREMCELEKQLAAERALADRLAEALTDCMGDSEELLGERSWWKDEPRKSYQEDYNKTVTNYKRADSVIQQWKEARSECR